MTTRQDAWSKDEDVLLAETVLRYIREGKTQMKAFEEVGHRLSRTPQACGFRWNANLRKHYKKAIELAKESRKKLAETPVEINAFLTESNTEPVSTFDQVIRQLEQLKGDYYKQGETNSEDHDSDVQSLKQRLTQYERLIDDIYNKIHEVKK